MSSVFARGGLGVSGRVEGEWGRKKKTGKSPEEIWAIVEVVEFRQSRLVALLDDDSFGYLANNIIGKGVCPGTVVSFGNVRSTKFIRVGNKEFCNYGNQGKTLSRKRKDAINEPDP